MSVCHVRVHMYLRPVGVTTPDFCQSSLLSFSRSTALGRYALFMRAYVWLPEHARSILMIHADTHPLIISYHIGLTYICVRTNEHNKQAFILYFAVVVYIMAFTHLYVCECMSYEKRICMQKKQTDRHTDKQIDR